MEICASNQEGYPTQHKLGLNNVTIEQRLIQKQQCLKRELHEVTEALEALQANPEILKVMSLISKVNY